MQTIRSYEILSSKSAAGLIIQVLDYASAGWVPQGGLVVRAAGAEEILYQAMVLPTKVRIEPPHIKIGKEETL